MQIETNQDQQLTKQCIAQRLPHHYNQYKFRVNLEQLAVDDSSAAGTICIICEYKKRCKIVEPNFLEKFHSTGRHQSIFLTQSTIQAQ